MDAHVAQHEWPVGDWPTDPSLMETRHNALVEAGLLDPDEPTPWTHWLAEQEATREFTPEERRRLRWLLDA